MRATDVMIAGKVSIVHMYMILRTQSKGQGACRMAACAAISWLCLCGLRKSNGAHSGVATAVDRTRCQAVRRCAAEPPCGVHGCLAIARLPASIANECCEVGLLQISSAEQHPAADAPPQQLEAFPSSLPGMYSFVSAGLRGALYDPHTPHSLSPVGSNPLPLPSPSLGPELTSEPSSRAGRLHCWLR